MLFTRKTTAPCHAGQVTRASAANADLPASPLPLAIHIAFPCGESADWGLLGFSPHGPMISVESACGTAVVTVDESGRAVANHLTALALQASHKQANQQRYGDSAENA